MSSADTDMHVLAVTPRNNSHPESASRTRRRTPPGADPTIIPPAGEPGHGTTAYLRRRPVQMRDGRAKGGYTDVFELICRDCGDYPALDYAEVPPRLQSVRGHYTLEAGLAEYDRHLGLAS
jgi:hypothetical protein